MLDELELHLSTTTNRLGRPYQQGTIRAYMTGARTLHRWMIQAGVEQDFTACDTALLNRFFRHHYDTHDVPKSQDGKGGYTGGTSTLQRNVRVLFAWLEEEYEHPNPWRDKKLHRYSAPPQGKPKTLSSEFVTDCLRITGNGNPRIRDFETTRDHAIIRVLTEGLRAEELLSIRIQDLDLPSHTLVVVPLKGDRNSQDGRTIPLQPKTVRALHDRRAAPSRTAVTGVHQPFRRRRFAAPPACLLRRNPSLDPNIYAVDPRKRNDRTGTTEGSPH